MGTSETLNHEQTPAASHLGREVEAEQRSRRPGSINELPEKQSKDGQLVIDGRDPDINGF